MTICADQFAFLHLLLNCLNTQYCVRPTSDIKFLDRTIINMIEIQHIRKFSS